LVTAFVIAKRRGTGVGWWKVQPQRGNRWQAGAAAVGSCALSGGTKHIGGCEETLAPPAELRTGEGE